MKKNLRTSDKPLDYQKAKFRLALKDYALGELLLPKFRRMICKQKMTIFSCAHPTNDYRYRQ